jgi:predicted aspartyl protease
MKSILLLFFFPTLVFAQSMRLESLRQEVKQDVRQGRYEKALSVLNNNLLNINNDTTGLFDALINLCLFEKRWKDIIGAYSVHHCAKGEDTTSLSLARYYARYPAEQIQLNKPVDVPYKPSPSGTPIVEVWINGKIYHFWFDTGAGITVLSERTAAHCGIKEERGQAGQALAATGKTVSVFPGVIDSIQIGAMKVYHHPCIILSNRSLEIKVLGIRILKIDGIIGWNILQELDVTIRNKEKVISLGLSSSHQSDEHNFFWYGTPLIACKDSTGKDFLFFIDTGGDQPGLYQAVLTKIDTSQAKKKTIVLGSAGGVRKINSFLFPRFQVMAGGHTFVLKNVSVYPNNPELLYAPDGVLGINEFKNTTLRFNVKQGYLIVVD